MEISCLSYIRGASRVALRYGRSQEPRELFQRLSPRWIKLGFCCSSTFRIYFKASVVNKFSNVNQTEMDLLLFIYF